MNAKIACTKYILYETLKNVVNVYIGINILKKICYIMMSFYFKVMCTKILRLL